MGGFGEMSHPSLPQVWLESRLALGLSLGLWEGWVGGFWEMSHPSLPWVRVTVMVGVRFIFRFMGGVGGWFHRNLDGSDLS